PAGTTKLICVGETKNSGAGMPLMVNIVSASVTGNGVDCAISTRGARFVPKAAAMESAASGPRRKSAALTAATADACTTLACTALTSESEPSEAVKLIVTLRPTSPAAGVQRNVPRALLLVSFATLNVAPSGNPSAVIVIGTPEPRS